MDAVSGIFMDPDEMYDYGLSERVPTKAFYDVPDHWSIIMCRLAGRESRRFEPLLPRKPDVTQLEIQPRE